MGNTVYTDRLLREPLLHFLLLGALLFGVYGVMHRGAKEAGSRIVVDQTQVDILTRRHEQLWLRPPTQGELQGLVDRWVREEILYREGMLAGLATDDAAIRNRIVVKMQLMVADLATHVPTDAELGQWLEQHADRYRIPAKYAFRQFYVDPQRAGANALESARRALDVLRKGNATPASDPSLLPTMLQDVSADEIARTFDRAFVEALDAMPIAEWHGPVRSAYGFHLVRIDSRVPGHAATLEEARAAVSRDFMNDRTNAAVTSYFDNVRQHYTVEVSAKLPAPSMPGSPNGVAPTTGRSATGLLAPS